MNEHGRQADVDQRSHAIQSTRVATRRTYDDLVRVFASELGHLDPVVSRQLVEWKADWSEVERVIEGMAGRHELMIIARVELGSLTSLRGQERRCSLYLVGNPVIASQIIAIDPRGSFYVPFRVALYDDGGPTGGDDLLRSSVLLPRHARSPGTVSYRRTARPQDRRGRRRRVRALNPWRRR